MRSRSILIFSLANHRRDPNDCSKVARALATVKGNFNSAGRPLGVSFGIAWIQRITEPFFNPLSLFCGVKRRDIGTELATFPAGSILCGEVPRSVR